MRKVMLAALCLGACFEVVDHTPPGSCQRDSDCTCGSDCYVPNDGDLLICGARIRASCSSDLDCHGSDGGAHCVHLVRDGGACSYKQCVDVVVPGLCQSDSDCACGSDCYTPSGGDLPVCGAALHPTCATDADCHHSDAGAHCVPLMRDGGACSDKQCADVFIPGLCQNDSDCACGSDCYALSSGDLPVCGAAIHPTCASEADCHHSDAGAHCVPLVRDGGACSYNQCADVFIPGLCQSNDDCDCGSDCYSPDGGDLTVCGPMLQGTCGSDVDCAHSDAGPHCMHVARDGGVCSYLQCQ
jgi:hypothetical protein